MDARRRLGIGELGWWGVVGQGGASSESPPPKMELVELRGSNMTRPVREAMRFFRKFDRSQLERGRSGEVTRRYYIKCLILHFESGP